MKNARKLTSLLLALLLVFALAATAAADDTGTPIKGTITVDNPITGQDYTAYKIFDVVYDDATPTKLYSYTIKGDSAWIQTVQNYANGTDSGLTLTPVADTTSNTFVVTFDENKFSAPKFAAVLKTALKADTTAFTGTDLEKSGNPVKASATVNELGYYFVTSSTGALCNLTTTAPDVNIRDKNDVPFNKEGDKTNADVGQTVTYKITGKVPDYTGFDKYTYEITDTMSPGLTFDNTSVEVKIGTSNVESGSNGYTLNEPTDTDTDKYTFKLSINVKQFEIGKEIVVTYKATVNEKAIAKIENNDAYLTYTNGPTEKENKTSEHVQKKSLHLQDRHRQG